MIAGTVRFFSVVTAAVLLIGANAATISGVEPRAQRTVYVTVLDGSGPIVAGLDATEFRVFEDNVEREVISVKPAEEPVSAVLMIDTTAAAGEIIQELRKAVLDYAKVLFSTSPGSRLALAEFAGVGMLTQKFTTSYEDIERQATRIVANTEVPSVFNEGLMAASDELEREESPRRALVTVNMEPTVEQSTVRIPNVAAKVRDSGASVFSIAILNSAQRDPNRDALLQGVTTNSGGLKLSINSPTALNGLLGTIAAISATQWAVTFDHPDDASTAERTEVMVSRPDVRVLSNSWARPSGDK